MFNNSGNLYCGKNYPENHYYFRWIIFQFLVKVVWIIKKNKFNLQYNTYCNELKNDLIKIIVLLLMVIYSLKSLARLIFVEKNYACKLFSIPKLFQRVLQLIWMEFSKSNNGKSYTIAISNRLWHKKRHFKKICLQSV